MKISISTAFLFLVGLLNAGTNNWCPENFDEIDANCFACSDNVCRVCETGYVHYAKGMPCVPVESIQVKTSMPVENLVFIQNSEIYAKYKDIWRKSSEMYPYTWGQGGNKFLLQEAVASIFKSIYGDRWDFAYITSLEDPLVCSDYQSRSSCEDMAHCRWSNSQCVSNGYSYPHQYGNFWPEGFEFEQMLGTVFWQPSFESMSGAFGTHFHEIAHHYNVWWEQYSGKNNWMSHQGTTGMDRWGMMGGFDKSTITCDSPAGVQVTSSNSCNANANGEKILRFPSENGRSQFQSSDSFGDAQFSDWELLAMGMKTVGDLGDQTMLHCWAPSQTPERYPQSGQLEGYKVPCSEVNFYTAQELKDESWNWRPAKHEFSAAHIIILPDDLKLPTSYAEMPAGFQKISDWLKADVPAEFVKATRNSGVFDFKIADVAVELSEAPSSSPVQAVSTRAPSSSPVQVVSTRAPSSSPVQVVSTRAPSSSPVQVVSTRAPSSQVVSTFTTTHPAAPTGNPTAQERDFDRIMEDSSSNVVGCVILLIIQFFVFV